MKSISFAAVLALLATTPAAAIKIAGYNLPGLTAADIRSICREALTSEGISREAVTRWMTKHEAKSAAVEVDELVTALQPGAHGYGPCK
jgi:hypothetical protein